MDETKKSEFIELVRDRPALWDQKVPEYGSRMRDQNLMWQNIAESLNVDVEMVKKTWANMRDYFRKELKNVPLTTTGMAAVDKYNSKWPYWKVLLFLVPVLHPRPTEGNLSLIEELVVEQDEEHELDLAALGPTASAAALENGSVAGATMEGPPYKRKKWQVRLFPNALTDRIAKAVHAPYRAHATAFLTRPPLRFFVACSALLIRQAAF
ncbi:hypothetical protein V9T40_004288 [Parthenolecanium corni]|uniref:MADF domain-containing protein n=1 Tax=Parthenolecanium corni TaxID=536013 RepID=A0AAN9TWC8_9HEMI